MENQLTSSKEQIIISSQALLDHWQGHRRLTRRVIDAFSDGDLFNYSIGGMRPFSEMAREIMGLAGTGMKGIVTGNWIASTELDYRSGNLQISTKADILRIWDKVTDDINSFWSQLPLHRFQETIHAFGEYEGEITGIILYWIDNEIHHRAQGTVYLRSLGIEPPAFWNRD